MSRPATLQSSSTLECPLPPYPPNYDPFAPEEHRFQEFGLPKRPPETDPAYPFWADIAEGLRSPVAQKKSLAASGWTTSYNRLEGRGRVESSRNWSGGVVAAPYRHDAFQTIYGRWTVPAFSAPVSQTSELRCSIWIGFDGHRRTSRSLPQVGTTLVIPAPGKTSNDAPVVAWRQWWRRGDPDAIPHEYPALEIKVGDRLIASVDKVRAPTGQGPDGVIANLVRLPREAGGESAALPPSIMFPPEGPWAVRALDAECIVERPSLLPPGTGRYLLPKFQMTAFECCAVHASGQSRKFAGASLIRMIHVLSDPARVTTFARARRTGSRSGQITVARGR